MGTRILTVEDDERIRTSVRLALEDEGWTVDEASTGEDAARLFAANPADVVLIDIMLPGIDGFELCRQIRNKSSVPIVMVTARSDTHDVVAGLEAGADDYMTKPFAPKELSARIRALLRRARPSEQQDHTILEFGDLHIIPAEGRVTLRGADVAVGVEFDTYLYAARLEDVTDLANEIGQTYGGWYDVAKAACMVGGRWKSLCIGQAPAAWNYRVDHFAAAGINAFPDTFDDLLTAAKTLHARGTPIGMTLGHASGDGRSTNYPVLWGFGGQEFAEDGRTVTLDSPQTLRAVEWYAEIYKYFIPGTTAWLDADNNQAFLASKISATVNVNTI